MVSRDMSGNLSDLKNEVDEILRNAGYIRPSGANYLALSTARRFSHSTFCTSAHKINISDYMQYV